VSLVIPDPYRLAASQVQVEMSAKSAVQIILPDKNKNCRQIIAKLLFVRCSQRVWFKFAKQKMFCGCSGRFSQLNVCPSSKKHT
jgi:hypothetical protein